MKNSLKIKRLVGIGALLSIVVVLQIASSFVKFGPFSITLALIPLVVGAILYGPTGGAYLGFAMGLVVLGLDAGAFWAINPFATIVICLTKSTLAGVASGFVYKSLKNKNNLLATILASIVAPLVNTGLFVVGVLTLFLPTLKEWANGDNIFVFLFVGMIGLNFVIEFAINSILSPTVYYIEHVIASQFNLGQKNLNNDEEE